MSRPGVPSGVRAEDVQYLVDHQIPDVINELVDKLGKAAPADPVEYMLQWVEEKRKEPKREEGVRKVATEPKEGQKTGTSGLRKKVATFIQPHYLANWLQSLFNTLKEDPKFEGCTLAVGGDGRYWNDTALQLIIKMAFANGVRKLIIGQKGLLATPAMSAVIRKSKAFGGIIMTASHNAGGPKEDWGVKYNCSNGEPAPESLTGKIYEYTKTIDHYLIKIMKDIDVSATGIFKFDNDREIQVISSTDIYLSLLKEIFDFGAIKELVSRSDFTFVLDGMNGVGGVNVHALLEELGVPQEERAKHSLQCEPKADFGGHHPDPNLVHARHIVDLCFGRARDARKPPSFAAAFDGDADRNMILGEGVFVTPSDSVAIIAHYAAQCIPYFKTNGVKGLARSMPTAASLDRVARKLGVEVYEVPTGWKYFCNLMDAGQVSICGEESFGTSGNHIREKDGLWAVLAWLSIIAYRNPKGQEHFVGVKQILHEFWKEYGRSLYCRYDFESILPPQPNEANPADVLMQKLTELAEQHKLKEETFKDGEVNITVDQSDVFEYHDKVDHSVAKSQGIRFMFSNLSRIVFRLSGTGSEGATVRIYLEKYLAPEGVDCEIDSKDACRNLGDIAIKISKIRELTRMNEPTVIT